MNIHSGVNGGGDDEEDDDGGVSLKHDFNFFLL